MGREKPRKTCVRIGVLLAEILTHDLTNTKQECQPLDHHVRQSLVVNVCPRYLSSQYSYILYLWVLHGSHCKQQIFPLNSINQLIFAMVKFGVLFEVWTEFLNII
jgi:hypothetical protein